MIAGAVRWHIAGQACSPTLPCVPASQSRKRPSVWSAGNIPSLDHGGGLQWLHSMVAAEQLLALPWLVA